jgi:superfamily I DNA/RNA helicase
MDLPTYQELSKEQLEIYNLPLDGDYLVSGPPGTGKTVMALYRAQMYHNESDVTPTVVQYNNTLENYTSGATDEINVDGSITTFHRWFWYGYPEWVDGEDPPEHQRFHYNWDEIVPKVMVNDVDKVDAVLVDEGQDLPNGFYMSLPYLASQYTIFADENQRLSEEENSTLDDIREGAELEDELRLTKNYRNTREIAKLAREFFVGLETGKPDLPERRGEKPVVTCTDDAEHAARFIARYERTNDHERIGVLVKNTDTQMELLHLLREENTNHPVQAYSNRESINTLNFTTPGIQLLCFASAKGLEFDTVFMPEIQKYTSDVDSATTKMELYVMISRARERLFIIYSGADTPPILELFPNDLIERRQ